MSLLLKRKRRFPRLLQSPPSEEAQEAEEERYFTGPLGIWPWPIVNLILAIVDLIRSSIRSQTQTSIVSRYFPKVARRRREYVRDSSGRIIEVVEEIELE